MLRFKQLSRSRTNNCYTADESFLSEETSYILCLQSTSHEKKVCSSFIQPVSRFDHHQLLQWNRNQPITGVLSMAFALNWKSAAFIRHFTSYTRSACGTADEKQPVDCSKSWKRVPPLKYCSGLHMNKEKNTFWTRLSLSTKAKGKKRWYQIQAASWKLNHYHS